MAAVTGNTVNYLIGRTIGNRVFTHDYRWIDRAALETYSKPDVVPEELF